MKRLCLFRVSCVLLSIHCLLFHQVDVWIEALCVEHVSGVVASRFDMSCENENEKIDNHPNKYGVGANLRKKKKKRRKLCNDFHTSLRRCSI